MIISAFLLLGEEEDPGIFEITKDVAWQRNPLYDNSKYDPCDRHYKEKMSSTSIFYEQAASAIHLNWREVSNKPEEDRVR